MLDREATTLPKWPFLLSDALLLGVAAWLGLQGPPTDSVRLAIVLCVIVGAVVAIVPFVLQYRTTMRMAEVRSLMSISEHMNQIRSFSNQISFAAAQWQVVRDQADQTVTTAKHLAESVATEAKAINDFLKEADTAEKKQLRLEVDKFRRAEAEWLQIVVRLLDHVFALHQAAVRSGQQRIIDQLNLFQHACRDTVRRVGLVPFAPAADEPFDEKIHQPNEENGTPASGARIERTLAAGFTYQGQLLRPALVSLKSNGELTATPADIRPS